MCIRDSVGGTGSSSGVLRVDDPIAQMEIMLAAMKRAWMEMHGNAPGMQQSRGTIG